ncbi:MAG: SDR family NAD(P)-dependent oxidoreductase [Prolixibacteraceae bacterium]|nr:SDR family NAD(P)-dependent oxidoreductase [Prolixibacteraceae bacterium]
MSKTAFITGASKRVGKALAEHLASAGWSVIIHFNSSEKEAHELALSLTQKFPQQNFETIKANLSEMNEVENLISGVVEKYGKFELLVNNASVFDPGYIAETDTKLFDLQMNVNLKAPFFLMRDFARSCKEGNIINFVDTRITTNKSNFAAYSISKKALWDLTKMAALEFAPKIRVNAIAPGVTLPPEDKDETYLQKLAGNIPMKKPGGLIPILRSFDYILQNEHLTGQLLFADGGENLGQNV